MQEQSQARTVVEEKSCIFPTMFFLLETKGQGPLNLILFCIKALLFIKFGVSAEMDKFFLALQKLEVGAK